jgi:apolipoprotein N-acyltransferase
VYMLFDRRYVLEQTRRARSSGAPNLIGTMHADFRDGRRRYYNAAVQLSSEGEFSEPYLKRKLVPFAEQAPYQELLPFLRRDFLEKYLTFIKTYDVQWWSDFRPGDSIMILEFDSLKYAPLICFEIAYPEYVRESLHRGAEFILTITNDTWFKKSAGPFQHERISIMRAVENRAWLARAANTGFTFIANPYGRVTERLPWYTRGALIGEIDKHYDKSTYYRRGPVLARICFIFTILTGLFFAILNLSAKLGMPLEPQTNRNRA